MALQAGEELADDSQRVGRPIPQSGDVGKVLGILLRGGVGDLEAAIGRAEGDPDAPGTVVRADNRLALEDGIQRRETLLSVE